MALVPDNTLLTATSEEGRELADHAGPQDHRRDPDRRRDPRRPSPKYANDPDSLAAAAHVVAIELATVAAANNYGEPE